MSNFLLNISIHLQTKSHLRDPKTHMETLKTLMAANGHDTKKVFYLKVTSINIHLPPKIRKVMMWPLEGGYRRSRVGSSAPVDWVGSSWQGELIWRHTFWRSWKVELLGVPVSQGGNFEEIFVGRWIKLRWSFIYLRSTSRKGILLSFLFFTCTWYSKFSLNNRKWLYLRLIGIHFRIHPYIYWHWYWSVDTRAHNLCHDNRQLIVNAINRNHSASKINCN